MCLMVHLMCHIGLYVIVFITVLETVKVYKAFFIKFLNTRARNRGYFFARLAIFFDFAFFRNERMRVVGDWCHRV